uniref:Ubiquitin-like protease family profile domain-containing protein n=1 Tax=Cannabis sativa TaxID=3483 RepID=A0A803P554_CANSA
MKGTTFGQFWKAETFAFSSVLVHQLMLHKMKVQVEKANEVWFYIGRNRARFGVVEFALIAGLNFMQGPSIEEKNVHLGNDQLLNLYFNKSRIVNMEHLTAQFLNCEIVEDVYKLRLCLFMEGVLMGRERNTGITSEVVKKFAVSHGIQVPRMLSWSSKEIDGSYDIPKKILAPIFSKRQLNVLRALLPRPDEEAYARTITYNDVEIVFEMGVNETLPENDAQDPAVFQSHAEKFAQHIKFATVASSSGLDCREFQDLEQRSGADAHPQSPPMEDVDVIPDNYDPYVDENTSTPADATNISIVESQSQGEILPLERPPEDDRLLESFRRWLYGSIPNHSLWDVKTGDYGPKTHKGLGADFKWGDNVLDYCRGVKDQFYLKWGGNDYLYFVLNLPKHSHWVAIKVNIDLWKITVYDCDSTVCPKKDLAAIMKTWQDLLPTLFHACGEFPNNNQILAVEMNDCSKFPKMHFDRVSHEIVSKEKISGDCGIYSIKYVEHLMMKRSLNDVTDKNIQMFRDRWCVDLFYQNLS